MKLNDVGLEVMKRRYLQAGETPEQLFRRVAKAVAKAEEEVNVDAVSESFYEMMTNLDFLPNSPTLMNAGRAMGQLSACFVLPLNDSMHGIFTTLYNMAMVQRSGGGCGFNFGALRPKGSEVSTTRGVSSGPVSFMRVFNAASNEIEQGGMRRGANMGCMSVYHPNIREFITCKSEEGTFTNFNISVLIDRYFLRAVRDDGDIDLYFGKDVYETVRAKEIFDLICEYAHKNGEPGVIFIDHINNKHPLRNSGEITATNPCLTGDTLIKTVEGQIPIKDLVGKEIDVYCVDDNYKLTIARARNIHLTQKNANLVKVITTKGTVICTPNHKFYTRNRGYVEAVKLLKHDKLVALNVAPKNQKYVKVYLTGQSAQVPAEHVFLASHYYDIRGKNVHHIDNDSTNNILSNIEVLAHDVHSSLSNMEHIDYATHDELGRWRKGKKQKVWNNPQGVHPVGVNMRLIEVCALDYTEDVYDLEVEKYHNFFANYVCVHNCGEQPLLPYESCNLGSINLANFHNPYNSDHYIDWTKLSDTVRLAVRFLDNVITINQYPIPKIEETTQRHRKIGLGVMGWATLLQKMKIPYNSSEARTLADIVMKYINDVAHDESEKLGKTKGGCFDGDKQLTRRNATVTTIAPTGTLATIAGVSYGIEPIFALKYQKKMVDTYHDVIDTNFIEALGCCVTPEVKNNILNKVIKSGSCQNILEVPVEMREVYRTASEIPWKAHVAMQAVFQKHTDNAVSKTINLPEEATVEEIGEIIFTAYDAECKGLTLYRNNSRKHEAVSIGTKKKEESSTEPLGQWLNIKPRKRPAILNGFTERVQTGCGKMYITVNFDDQGHPFEVFAETDSGGCEAFSEGVSRMASLALRAGIDVKEVIEQLRSVKCTNFGRKAATDNIKGKSCPDVIGRVLESSIKAVVERQQVSEVVESGEGDKCPNCGKGLNFAEGCWSCTCGFSRCS